MEKQNSHKAIATKLSHIIYGYSEFNLTKQHFTRYNKSIISTTGLVNCGDELNQFL